MSNINANIIKEVEEHVCTILEKNLSPQLTYHNLDHTKYVVAKTKEIGKNSGLSEEELTTAIICAWFHDIGFAVDAENHEKLGAELAADFLSSQGIDDQTIQEVKNCILSTKLPQNPQNLIQQVVCDADLAHLACDDYFSKAESMRKERSYLLGVKVTKRKFFAKSVRFFESLHYYTEYAKKEYDPLKIKNLERLKQKIKLLDQKKENASVPNVDKKKDKGYSRGVDSMFKLTARNQINLSSIADNKSNILISVNAIMISVTMTVVVSRFDDAPNLIIPTLIFLAFSLTTIIFAILSTRPNISTGTFTQEDIKNNKVNLLFFGNFYNMELDEYEWAIEELMKNDEDLYSTMIKDQHSLGKVLAKKYKLLRIAYNIFMIGIIVSVLSFVLAFVH